MAILLRQKLTSICPPDDGRFGVSGGSDTPKTQESWEIPNSKMMGTGTPDDGRFGVSGGSDTPKTQEDNLNKPAQSPTHATRKKASPTPRTPTVASKSSFRKCTPPIFFEPLGRDLHPPDLVGSEDAKNQPSGIFHPFRSFPAPDLLKSPTKTLKSPRLF